MSGQRLLEVVVETAAGLRAVERAGADRIELCSALDVGGLTPSYGLMEAAAACPVPTMALIRPRGADFLYDEAELSLICRDINAAREAGLCGVVIGAGDASGLDRATMETMACAASGLEITLHRVIDVVDDPLKELEFIHSIGVARVLTSGGAASAPEGAARIKEMIAAAPAGLIIMPGAGIKPSNIADLAQATGAVEYHASCRSGTLSDPALAAKGFCGAEQFATDQGVIEETLKALRGA